MGELNTQAEHNPLASRKAVGAAVMGNLLDAALPRGSLSRRADHFRFSSVYSSNSIMRSRRSPGE